MNIKQTALRKGSLIATVITAMFVLSAALASAADASSWYAGTTETNGTKLASPEPFSVTTGEHTFESGVYKGTSGKKVSLTFLLSGGTPVTITATGLQVSKHLPVAEIFNGVEPAARSNVRLTFTGAKVSLAHCRITDSEQSGQFTTNILRSELISVGGKTFERLTSSSGSPATLEFENEGGSCPIAGASGTTGTLAAEIPNPGTSAKSHELVFSKAAASAIGSEWRGFGGSATLEATAIETLKSGNYWYAQ